MITNFTSDSWNSIRFNWTVKSGGISGDGPPAGQKLSLYSVAMGVTTTFNSVTYTDAVDLSWARTMLHESVHAYLTVYFKIDGINAKATYPQIIQEWGSRNKDLNAIHQDEMTRSLVGQIGDALELYGVSIGYKLDKQFYQDMAWAL